MTDFPALKYQLPIENPVVLFLLSYRVSTNPCPIRGIP